MNTLNKQLFRSVVVLFILGLGGCGPSRKEAGTAVILASPLVFLIGLGFVWIFYKLWSRRFPDLKMSWKPGIICTICLLLFSLPFMVNLPQKTLDWAVSALWIFGTSYLTVLFIVFRISFFFSQNTFTWIAIPLILFYSFFALSLIDSESSASFELFMILCIFPGYGGIVSGIVFLILLIEVLIRTQKNRIELIQINQDPISKNIKDRDYLLNQLQTEEKRILSLEEKMIQSEQGLEKHKKQIQQLDQKIIEKLQQKKPAE